MQDNRFDHMIKKMLDAHESMEYHARNLNRHAQEFRRQAYRFAKMLIKCQRHWHNDLLSFAASKGLSLTDWIDQQFSVIESMGESRARLMRAIDEGCTQRQYISKGVDWLILREHKTARYTVKSPKPSVPSASPTNGMSDNEKIAYLLECQIVDRKTIMELKTSLRTANANNARVLRENDRLRKVIASANNNSIRVHAA